MVSDSTENVDLFVGEAARTMIMSSNIEVRHFKPEVDVCIIHLALDLGIVLLLSRASDYDKLLAEPAGGVAMSGVLHAVSLHEVEASVDLNFKEVVESGLVFLVVTSADHVELTIGPVDGLEVVGELVSGLALEDLA